MFKLLRSRLLSVIDTNYYVPNCTRWNVIDTNYYVPSTVRNRVELLRIELRVYLITGHLVRNNYCITYYDPAKKFLFVISSTWYVIHEV